MRIRPAAGPRPSGRAPSERSAAARARRGEESGAVTTEFVLIYGALLALVMSVIHFGLVFNAALAVTDAADAVLETAQRAAAPAFSAKDLAAGVVGDELLVRELTVEVTRGAGEVVVTVSAESPAIVPGLPVKVSHTAGGPVERFIPEGRR